jgi:hypothetical protein
MSHIIIIQSYIRRFICTRQYINIYSAIYKIQNFILHRIDNKLLLENIKYLANFSKANDKAAFIQNKNKIILDTVKEERQKESKILHKKTLYLQSVIEQKNKSIIILENNNKQLLEDNQYMQTKMDTIIRYKKKIENENETLLMNQNELEKEIKRLENVITTIQTDVQNYTDQYNQSNESNDSLKHINNSLQDVNVGLCTKLGDIYLDLAKTTTELHKHKNKTVWDILFNKV